MWFIIGALCVLHVFSIERKSKWLFYLTKATPILLMSYLVFASTSSTNCYAFFIAIGLIVCAIGDLFLMHPKDKFLPGLSCFLIAHLIYSYAFFSHTEGAFGVWLPAVLFSLGVVIYLLLLPSLDKMRIPVALYSTAILLMAWGAIEVWLDARSPYAAYGAMGSLIFIISDVVLAIDRFRSSSAFSRQVIMVTYYTAQVLFTLSALSAYNG